MSRKQLLLYLIAFIISAVVIVSLLISSFFSRPSEQVINVAPSPFGILRGVGQFPSLPPQVIDNTSLSSHPNGSNIQQTITPEDEIGIKRDQLIGELIKKQPIHSELFVLRYDIETNSFVVSFIQDKVTEANKAFDQFLKDNHIENRNWLYNLSIRTQTY